jgi:thiamine biosynthesis lipoprotein
VSEFVLGTVCTINLYDKGTDVLYETAFGRLRELEDILSANRADTDLDRVNRNAGQGPVTVRPELVVLLEKALGYAELSGGAFDPTVGPLVKLWGIGGDNPRIPSETEIRDALDHIDRESVLVDSVAATIFLRRPGMMLDLGAIAKG